MTNSSLSPVMLSVREPSPFTLSSGDVGTDVEDSLRAAVPTGKTKKGKTSYVCTQDTDC